MIKKFFLVFCSMIFIAFMCGCENNKQNVETVSSVESSEIKSEEYRLQWLVCSKESLDSMDDKQLIDKYIDLKLFEQKYKSLVHESILSTGNFYYPSIYIFDSAYKMPANNTIDSFIVNSNNEENLRKYFDSLFENTYIYDKIKSKKFDSYSDYLNSISETEKNVNREEVEKYLLNFSLVNGKPCFKENLLTSIDYLNNKIFLFELEDYSFKFDAFNELDTGGLK